MPNPFQVIYDGPTEFISTAQELAPFRVTLICHEGLAAGNDVQVSIRNFRSVESRRWAFEGVTVQGGDGTVVLGHVLPASWADMTRGGSTPGGGAMTGRPQNDVPLVAVLVTEDITPGASLTFAFRALLCVHAELVATITVSVRGMDDPAFAPVGEPIRVTSAAGPAARLEARASVAPDGSARLVAYATDALLNPIKAWEQPVALDLLPHADDDAGDKSPAGALDGLPGIVTMSPGDGRAVVDGLALVGEKPACSRAVARVRVRDASTSLEAISPPLVTARDGGVHVYFGAIHFHSRHSLDGDRDPAAAYTHARDWLNLDVAAITDHTPLGRRWQETVRAAEAFNDPGRFVTLPAWESANVYGHANIYLRHAEVDATPGKWNPEVCPSEVTWPADAVVVPHHPNTGAQIERGTHWEALADGRYWTPYDWSMPNPRMRLVEIVQGRSCFEMDALDDDWGVVLAGSGSSVRDALAQGWRLGFCAGTDNHCGYPTQKGGEYVGMTAFLAPELTREAIWQAMDQRHTYATSGVPIVCRFSVNGAAMGSEIAWAEGEGVRFDADLHGTAPIAVVEVISNGACVWHDEPNAWDVSLCDVPLPAPDNAAAYYYLRLRQTDGHKAWVSPVYLSL